MAIMMYCSQEESRTLARLRGGMSLPRVMRGEIRVKEVEKEL